MADKWFVKSIGFLGAPAFFNNLLSAKLVGLGVRTYNLTEGQLLSKNTLPEKLEMVIVDYVSCELEVKKWQKKEEQLLASGITKVLICNLPAGLEPSFSFKNIMWKVFPFGLSSVQINKWLEVHIKRVSVKDRLSLGNYVFNPGNWSQVYDLSQRKYIQLPKLHGGFLSGFLKNFQFQLPQGFLEKALGEIDRNQFPFLLEETNFFLKDWTYKLHRHPEEFYSLQSRLPWNKETGFEWERLELSEERVQFEHSLLESKIEQAFEGFRLSLVAKDRVAIISKLSSLLGYIILLSGESFKNGQELLKSLRLSEVLSNSILEKLHAFDHSLQPMVNEQLRLIEQKKKIA